jgi:hypothetical protein
VIPQPFAKLVNHCSAIMPTAAAPLGRLIAAMLILSSSALAQNASSSDPALKLIRGGGTPAVFKSGETYLPPNSCPAIVNVNAGEIQPLRLPASEVAAKNQLGCLSPNDAIYGVDGCPLRLCGQNQGSVPLPKGVGLSESKLQLPEP